MTPNLAADKDGRQVLIAISPDLSWPLRLHGQIM
jgi:hypothetical protein